MPSQVITFIKGDKVGLDTDYRDALPVNMYAVAKPMLGAQGYMIQESGLSLHAGGFGPDRGGIWNERFRDHYRVSGSRLIKVDSTGGIDDLGGVGSKCADWFCAC